MLAVHNLEYRAAKLRAVRQFFFERDYLEIDPPCLGLYADPNPYIEPIQTKCGRFLHTSPELEMKKTLAQIQRDCYFLGHVFRHEEVGPNHSEEFTMIEYYKTNTTKEAFLDEVLELIELFIKPKKVHTMTYQQAFDAFVPKDYSNNSEIQKFNSEEKRHWAWGVYVEKNLKELTIIHDFLPQDASLAKLNERGLANRFEFYYNGIELANAFEELLEPMEQKTRFEAQNQIRKEQNLDPLPLDPDFLDRLSHIPKQTFGIALGFDRLLKLSCRPCPEPTIIMF